MDALDPRHGTPAGYSAHRKNNETPCDACKDADRERRRAKALRNSKPCPLCGQLCRKESNRCRTCNTKDATRRAAIARNALREQRENDRVSERARRIREGDWPEEELEYLGGWVRRGLIQVPAIARPEEAA